MGDGATPAEGGRARGDMCLFSRPIQKSMERMFMANLEATKKQENVPALQCAKQLYPTHKNKVRKRW